MSKKKHEGIQTKAIHAGAGEDQFHSVTEPIYRSSTFGFPNIDVGTKRSKDLAAGKDSFIYSRVGNPTNAALEHRIAALEGAEACTSTASGIGAISTTLWTFLKAGDHVLADTALYGDTHICIAQVLGKFGVESNFVDFSNPANVKKSLKKNTKVVYFESPCNPTLKINDIAAISKIAHEHNAETKVIIDNTFASPCLQNPLSLGADIVLHSMTKYIGGHSDILGGCVCGSLEDILKVRFFGIQRATGAVLAPDNAYLAIRGVATLPLRMKIHCENARRVAEYLAHSPFVSVVHYPGLPSHPGHETAKKQMKDFGGMVSVELALTFEQTKVFVNNLKLIKLAVSLGGVETLLEHPASMTHSHLSPEELKAADITPSQVRLSVGVEDADDIIADLEQALNATK
ncbi:MAG: PLP-dependent aspartate aminotransferase family protein [Synergistaceae bacterium]|nr:PLP-dependent aspartate aminotransferase family protein [Synergistaceae bacterium]